MSKKFIVALTGVIFLVVLLLGQQEEINVLFSHKFHVIDLETSCSDCHKAEESKSSQDNLLPDHESCGACHEIDENCTMCHEEGKDPTAVPRIQDYIEHFPHEVHTGENFSCLNCHKNVEQSETVKGEHLPKMALCVECHDNRSFENYCYICHSKERNLMPVGHTKAFCEKDHGFASYMQDLNCESCHTQSMCIDCHRKDNLDHKAHPLNYINNHGMYAKGNKDNCYSCHEELSFCRDCHQQRMVMPRTHAAANWSNRTTGGRHARAAQLDLDNCISCHSDAGGNPICIQRHETK